MASVFTRPPLSAYSTRPRWVSPRFPPSATTRARRSRPSTRTASFALSPASRALSVDAFTYVPMPPLNSRSTGASRAARISSTGGRLSTPSGRPSAARMGAETGMDFAVRGHTPPPALIRERL